MLSEYVTKRFGLRIGLVFSDELYLKVNASNLSDYKDSGSEPFTYVKLYKKGKTVELSNWRALVEVLEDTEIFHLWPHKSYLVVKDLVKN